MGSETNAWARGTRPFLRIISSIPVASPFAVRGQGIPRPRPSNRLLKNPFSPRLLKKVQMQGGVTHQMGTRYPSAGWVQVRGVLRPYVAASRERANAADGLFSAAC